MKVAKSCAFFVLESMQTKMNHSIKLHYDLIIKKNVCISSRYFNLFLVVYLHLLKPHFQTNSCLTLEPWIYSLIKILVLFLYKPLRIAVFQNIS